MARCPRSSSRTAARTAATPHKRSTTNFADTWGKRRLEDPQDWVRIEIEAALDRNIPVIPVLVDDAKVLKSRELPNALKALARRNATEGSIGIKLNLIPAGDFMMGSPKSHRDAASDEKPQHLVRITKPFDLGVYPVTQSQYEQLMGDNPSEFKDDPQGPVECVSWEDAVNFCEKLSEKEGREYRLPTEAEWEYACRAGTTTRWYCGDNEDELGRVAWYGVNSGYTTHPVGEKEPNAWGLYDMRGNV